MARRQGNLEQHVFDEEFLEIGNDTFRAATISYIAEDGKYYDPKIYLQRFEGKDRADNDRWSKVQAVSLAHLDLFLRQVKSLEKATADVEKLRAIPVRGSVSGDLRKVAEADQTAMTTAGDIQQMIATAVAEALAAAQGTAAPATPRKAPRKSARKATPTPSARK